MSEHEKTLAKAVSQMLRHVHKAEHPITSIKVWRFSEDVGGGYGWAVVETPPAIEHGSNPSRFGNTDTKWDDLANQLIIDFENLAEEFRGEV